MKAIILAAGYATRLYPLTINKPKPLIEVGGKPMIEHIMAKIEESVDEVFVVTNDKFYTHFLKWAESYNSSIKINVINDMTKSNEDRLGAVGDIEYTLKKVNIDDDVLVIGGDNLFQFSILKLTQMFKEKQCSVVATRDLGNKELLAKKFGVIELDENSKIVGFQEKPENPKTSLASTCCYLFSKEHIKEFEKCIEENNKPDNTGDFIRYLSEKSKVYGFVFTEEWFDIGSHEQLEEVRKLYDDCEL